MRGPGERIHALDLTDLAIFATEEKRRLSRLFATSSLGVVQYRENADNVVPAGLAPGGLFDLVVATRDRGTLRSNHVEVGVTYLPDGPVLARVQSLVAGETRVFRALPYRAGAELAVVFSDETPASVSAAPSGAGSAAAALPEPDDPVGKGARAIGPWAVLAVAAVALVHLLGKKL